MIPFITCTIRTARSKAIIQNALAMHRYCVLVYSRSSKSRSSKKSTCQRERVKGEFSFLPSQPVCGHQPPPVVVLEDPVRHAVRGAPGDVQQPPVVVRTDQGVGGLAGGAGGRAPGGIALGRHHPDQHVLHVHVEHAEGDATYVCRKNKSVSAPPAVVAFPAKHLESVSSTTPLGP